MMKKYFMAIAVLFMLAACTQNKPSQATENEQQQAAQTEAADSIDPQTKQANMEEVQKYLKECGAFFIATVDGDQPRVRAFGVSEIIENRRAASGCA